MRPILASTPHSADPAGPGGIVIKFGKRAAKTYRRIAGRRIKLSCERVSRNADGYGYSWWKRAHSASRTASRGRPRTWSPRATVSSWRSTGPTPRRRTARWATGPTGSARHGGLHRERPALGGHAAEPVVHEAHDRGALADGGRAALQRSGAHVAGGVHAGHARSRAPRPRRPSAPGQHEALLVARDGAPEPVGARRGAEEQEQEGERELLAVAQRDRLELAVAPVQRGDLGRGRGPRRRGARGRRSGSRTSSRAGRRGGAAASRARRRGRARSRPARPSCRRRRRRRGSRRSAGPRAGRRRRRR